MAVDPSPLAIGGGALISDETMRVAVNAQTRDSQGINLPGHGKVTALGTPGAAVNVATGGFVIRNAQAPGQSYVARNATPTTVPIAANNSGATRRDLILGEIIDPDFAPWQPSGTPGAPNTSITDGPYFRIYAIPGVASGTTRASQVVSTSAVELARVDVPSGAASSAITDAMIVDLRSLAQPRVGLAYDVQMVATTNSVLVSETSWHDWPSNSLQVYVPRWATHAQATIDYLGVITNGGANMDTRVSFGGATGPASSFDNNTPASREIKPWSVYGEFIVTNVQDAVITMKAQAMRTITSNTGLIQMDTKQQLKFDVRFSERVI